MAAITTAIGAVFTMLIGMLTDVLELAVTNDLMLFGLALTVGLGVLSYAISKVKKGRA